MKKITFVAFMLMGLCTYGQNDLILHLNDSVMEISSGKDYQLPVNGEMMQLRIDFRDTLSYDDDLFSFQYLKDFKVSKMDIEQGIHQVMLMSADGSGILIQQYATMNPTMLNEMMIQEVTKESVNYGFQMDRQDYTRKIGSGETLNVARAVLTYRDEKNTYEVASLGKKDEGILIMTMVMDEENSEQGQKIIDLMWNSLWYR